MPNYAYASFTGKKVEGLEDHPSKPLPSRRTLLDTMMASLVSSAEELFPGRIDFAEVEDGIHGTVHGHESLSIKVYLPPEKIDEEDKSVYYDEPLDWEHPDGNMTAWWFVERVMHRAIEIFGERMDFAVEIRDDGMPETAKGPWFHKSFRHANDFYEDQYPNQPGRDRLIETLIAVDLLGDESMMKAVLRP